MLQELENALGEVEFKDGIPDVKFSKVIYMLIYLFAFVTLINMSYYSVPL